MGTNAIGCTEWERDFDPMTEKPRISICENGHQLDISRSIFNRHIKHITDDFAKKTLAGLLSCRGSMILCQELLAFLIRELRNEEHPQGVQDALNAAEGRRKRRLEMKPMSYGATWRNPMTKSVPQALGDLGSLYEERNTLYKDNYKHFGHTLLGMFPNGITLTTAEDFNRFAIFMQLVHKQSRYAHSILNGGHPDSLDDISVYSQMLQEYDGDMKDKKLKDTLDDRTQAPSSLSEKASNFGGTTANAERENKVY